MTAILTIRVTPELKAALEKAARDDARTLSSLVVKLLREGLAKQRGKAPKEGGQ